MIIGAFLYLIGLTTQTLSDTQLENVIISLENDTILSVIELYIYPEKPNWYVIIQMGDNTTLVKKKSKNAAEIDGKQLEYRGGRSFLKGLVSRVKQIDKRFGNIRKKVHEYRKKKKEAIRNNIQSIRKKYEETKNKYNRQPIKKKYEETKNKFKQTRKGTSRVNHRISAAVNRVKQDAVNRLKQLQKEAELRQQSLVKQWEKNQTAKKKAREGLKKINKETEQRVKEGIVYVKHLIDLLFGNWEKKFSNGVKNEREMNHEIDTMKRNIGELLREGKQRIDKVVHDTVGIVGRVNESKELLDPILKENCRRWSKWFVVV